MFGSFMGFRRCFVDGALFIKDEPQTFRDTYIGRITTGKIAMDTKNNPYSEWNII